MSAFKKSKDTRFLNFAVSFFIILIFSVLLCNKKPIYDSMYYWSEGESIWTGGFNFVFTNFPETFRGYVYPFLVIFFRAVGKKIFFSEWLGFLIGNSLMIAVTITLSIPKIFHIDMKNRRGLLGSIVFSLFVVIFWTDHLIYSLSDIPAMAMLFGSIAMIIYFKEQRAENSVKHIIEMLVISFAIGMLLYCSYNTRAVYQYSVVICFAVFLYDALKKVKKGEFIALFAVIAVFVGAAFPAVSQCKINEKYTGKFTAKVMTEQLFGYDSSLQMYQIVEGMQNKRYNSYIGATDKYNMPGVKYEDNTGKKIVEDENISLDNFGFKDVIRLYFKYPFEFARIYFWHFVSYITLFSGRTYIYNLFADKTLYFIFNAAIWFTAILGFLTGFKKKKHVAVDEEVCLSAAVVLPCLLIIPGAPETRFFVPLYFCVYGYICYRINYTDFYRMLSERKRVIIPILAVILCIWAFIAEDILKSNLIADFSLMAIPMQPVAVIIANALCYAVCFAFFIVLLRYFSLLLSEEQKTRYKKYMLVLGTITAIFCCIRAKPAFLNMNENLKSYLPKTYVVSENIYSFDEKVIPNTKGDLYVEQIPVSIKPDSLYRVDFEIDLKGKEIPEALYFDLYGDGYDGAGQDYIIKYDKSTKKYSMVLSSQNPPDNVVFRIVAKTMDEYTLKKLSLSRVIQK